MYIYKVKVQGFRKLHDAEFILSKSSFLIGENNSGKSSFLKVIKNLLSGGNKGLDEDDFCSSHDSSGIPIPICNQIIIEAEFRDLPVVLKTTKGFKGRIFEYKEEGETGLSMIIRKTFPLNGNVEVEIQTKKRTPKSYTSYEDVIKLGISDDLLKDSVGEIADLNKKVSAAHKKVLDALDEMVDIEDEIVWEKNPLGLISVFSTYLPRYIEIPALHSYDELNGNKTSSAIGEILKSLFDEVRAKSQNYQKAQEYLNNLAVELDPSDEASEFGKLIGEVNTGFDKLFLNAKFHVGVDLSKPDESIKPTFNTYVSSNLKTKIENQGTGLSRSAIFTLLKYRASWHQKKSDTEYKRSLFIAFEEPELYLHPSAIKQIRDFIYDLAEAGNTQIVCSTHAPHMIDLSRDKAKQVINRMLVHKEKVSVDGIDFEIESVKPFFINHFSIMRRLGEDEKDHLKMLLRMDASIVESFFVDYAVVVEGDTEQVVINESLSRLSSSQRDRIAKTRNVIRARGKPIILSLVKYLGALGVKFKVMHDSDIGKEGQENINQLIEKACGIENVHVLDSCIEDVLGYSPPSREKPYSAFNFTKKEWKDDLSKISEEWKVAFKFLFDEDIK